MADSPGGPAGKSADRGETGEGSIVDDAWEYANSRCSTMASVLQAAAVQRGSGSGESFSHRDQVFFDDSCRDGPLDEPIQLREAVCIYARSIVRALNRNKGVRISMQGARGCVKVAVRHKHRRPFATKQSPTGNTLQSSVYNVLVRPCKRNPIQ